MNVSSTAEPRANVRLGFARRLARSIDARLPLGIRALVVARREVMTALRAGVLDCDAPSPADSLAADDLPSTRVLGGAERVVAEIDQDGFLFAAHEADVPLFNRRATRVPRRRYRLELVLRSGRVLLRKRFAHQPLRGDWREWLKSELGLPFYNEAAALLRLRGVPGVPYLRDVDPRRRALLMDYVSGTSLRARIAGGAKVHDLDVETDPRLCELSRAELDRREIGLLGDALDARTRAEIALVSAAIVERGVAPIDVKAGNILIGNRTGSVYWIDFEEAHLRSVAQWERQSEAHRELVRRWFGG